MKCDFRFGAWRVHGLGLKCTLGVGCQGWRVVLGVGTSEVSSFQGLGFDLGLRCTSGFGLRWNQGMGSSLIWGQGIMWYDLVIIRDLGGP